MKKSFQSNVFIFCSLVLSLAISSSTYAQNVGIGEVSPASKLSIKGSLTVGSSYSTTAAPTDGLLVQGNVGIGTTNPNRALQVKTATNSQGISHTDGTYEIATYVGGVTAQGGWIGTVSNHPLIFYTNNSGYQVVLQNGTGYFGIGTKNPASLLSVGATSQFQVSSSGAIAAATGITSSGSITFSGLSTVGIVHNSAAGLLSTSAISLAGDVTGTLPVGNGGTGATTLSGYIFGNGTSAMTASTTIPGSAISGNITGSAANVTGTVAIANGGTGATSAAAALASLGALPATNVSGTANYVAKFTGSNTIGNGIMYDNGSGIGVGTSSIAGTLSFNNNGANITWGSTYTSIYDNANIHYWTDDVTNYESGATGTSASFNWVAGRTAAGSGGTNWMTLTNNQLTLAGLTGTGNRPVMANGSGTLNTVNRAGTTSQLFTSSGSFTVPAGVYQVYVELIGGGGGAAYCTSDCGGGGGGGGVAGTLPVTPGETLSITVGAGGSGNNSRQPGGGGKGSAIYRGGTMLCAAGGGSGGGYNHVSDYGQGGGSSGFGTSIDGAAGTSNTDVNVAGGNNNVDYLYNPISKQGYNDYSQQNFYNYAAFNISGGGITPYGRGGQKSYNSPGIQGVVLIYY